MHRDRESRARCSGARSFPGLGVLGLDPSRGSGFSDSVLPGARCSRTRSFPGLGVLGLGPSRDSVFSGSVLPRARTFPGIGPSRGSVFSSSVLPGARCMPFILLYFIFCSISIFSIVYISRMNSHRRNL
jgi:hypothetical protein